VVFVVLDDVGYAQLGCYGSDIATPAMDALAANGLRYRNFYTTAMCSPTRASLLTGCNHHTTAMGGIADQGTGYPGYNAQITKRTGFLSEILRDEGYATFALGKWHLAPREETSLGSPRRRWPLGRGFERFYGFMGAETNQYAPDLVHDNHFVEPPASDVDGYHLTEDLANRAIEWINDIHNAEPDRPFFAYFCPGAMHVPHHVSQEWVAPYRGQFDDGWDVWRKRAHARQIEMGVVPADAVLTPRPAWIEAWAEIPDERRRLYVRGMEVYAGFLTHTDHQIGRIVDHLRKLGELDNTIFVVISDNGASPEGGPHGSFNSNLYYNGEPETFEVSEPYLQAWGDPSTYPAYTFGWAHAGNTPFQRWKRETHEGGIADPLIIHYPNGIEAKGAVREQYAHVIDLMPRSWTSSASSAQPRSMESPKSTSQARASWRPWMTARPQRSELVSTTKCSVHAASTTAAGKRSPGTRSSARTQMSPSIQCAGSTKTHGSYITLPKTSQSRITLRRTIQKSSNT